MIGINTKVAHRGYSRCKRKYPIVTVDELMEDPEIGEMVVEIVWIASLLEGEYPIVDL